MPELGPIIPNPKTGNEKLSLQNWELNTSLLDFWRWSMSDLVNNTTRGIFAEFLVARALDIPIDNAREDWAAYDLLSPEGIRVEVKSAAYLQRWAQRDFSKIGFSIAPSRIWDAETNKMEEIASRSSDVYVFCLLHHMDAKTLNPLNLDQWTFYVVSTAFLGIKYPQRKSLGLKNLETIAKAVGWADLSGEVGKVFRG